jgi:hypothetical protein
VDLDAEGATDVLADHANLRVRKPEMEGCDVLHHVRRLRTLVDGQPLFGNIPVGHHRTGLQRHAGVPPKDEIRLHHLVGAGKRRIDSASVEVTFESKVVAERRMNHRGFGIERGAHVRYCIQFLVFNPDGFRCVLCHGAACRHRCRDGFPLPADAVDCDRMLRRRLEALQVRQHANPRRDDGRKLFARHDSDYIGHTPRFFGVDGDDPRMGMGRAQEHHMRHARQLDVADIKPASLHQPLEIGTRNHLADV